MNEGAPLDNQNARRHGWTSTISPAPVEDIYQAADTAAAIGDLPTLRHAQRALRFRAEHAETDNERDELRQGAAMIGKLIDTVTMQKREGVNIALSATRSDESPFLAPMTPQPTDRIARAYRPTVPWARGLE